MKRRRYSHEERARNGHHRARFARLAVRPERPLHRLIKGRPVVIKIVIAGHERHARGRPSALGQHRGEHLELSRDAVLRQIPREHEVVGPRGQRLLQGIHRPAPPLLRLERPEQR